MKKHSKRTTLALLSVALVATILTGATFAFLSALTGEAINIFSFGENIKAKLDEPNWKPNEGENLIPGYMLRKDPQITNLSDNGIEAFAAIRAVFTDGAGVKLSHEDAARLLTLLDIDWNTTDWVLADQSMENAGEQIWVYTHRLAPFEITNPLFNSVTIKSAVEGMTAEAWESEFAWMAGIALGHTDECYVFGTHDPGVCNIMYRHHANCPVYGDDNEAITEKGKTTDSGKACDCIPAEHHEESCPAVTGALTKDCGHTTEGLDGFMLVVQGAVVQAGADGMDDWTLDSDTIIANLTDLFDRNPYTNP